jgi:hypothetical protein
LTGYSDINVNSNINAYYAVSIGNIAPYTNSAMLAVSTTNGATSSVGILVRGVSGQTGDLQQWQNSSGTALSRIASNGVMKAYSGLVAENSTLANYTALQVNSNISNGNGIIVIGASGQTADLQQWLNSAGSIMVKVTSYGDFVSSGTGSFGGYFGGGILNVQGYTTTQTTSIFRAVASQTANLTEWQNSSGTVLAKVDASGNVNTTKSFVQTGTIGTTYAIDASGNQATYAANATVDFPNFSGMILIDCQLDGALSLWLCGGGSATRIGGSKTGGYDGNVAHNSGINGYTWTNANTSQNVNITAIRARSSA